MRWADRLRSSWLACSTGGRGPWKLHPGGLVPEGAPAAGDKHGTSFMLNASPSDGTSLETLAGQLSTQAQRFAEEPVSERELARFCKVRHRCLGACA